MSRGDLYLIAILACASACTNAPLPATRPQEHDFGSIGGVVVDERGRPVKDATVSLFRIEPWTVGIVPQTKTRTGGRFDFFNLGRGTYGVRAEKEADGYLDNGYTFRDDQPPTVILSTESASAHTRVVLGPKAGPLKANVTDAATGTPLHATVRMRVRDDGRFCERAMDPGSTVLIPSGVELELEVRAPGYRRREIPLRLGAGQRSTLAVHLWPETGTRRAPK